jgi:malate dehydrogenase
MTRLDQNRATSHLARQAGVPVTEVTRVGVWGNHSTTQYPDFANAHIGGRPAPEVIADHDWLRGDFITGVQKRGAAVIQARGSSSAASAANAVVDSVVSIRTPTDPGDFVSLAVPSSGEYGVPAGLQFGYPVRSTGTGWEVVAGLEHDDFGRDRIRVTTEELLEERSEVADLLG